AVSRTGTEGPHYPGAPLLLDVCVLVERSSQAASSAASPRRCHPWSGGANAVRQAKAARVRWAARRGDRLAACRTGATARWRGPISSDVHGAPCWSQLGRILA